MTCEFSFDDGAYVLGALAPAERAAFERHLSSCPPCREAVASLAVLPGLLGRLDASTATSAITAPPTLLPRTLTAAATRRRAEKRRRRWYRAAFAVAAALLAAAVGVGVHALDMRGTSPPPVFTPMHPVAGRSLVSAEVGLVKVYGGTRVEMKCRYEKGSTGSWTLRLVVYPRSGEAGEQIATWTAVSDREVAVGAMTHLEPAEIGRVELQRADRTPVLSWTPT